VPTALTTKVYFLILATTSKYHVSPKGNNEHNGSPGAMFKTILKTEEIARPSDVMTFHTGIYSECINQLHGGSSNFIQIT
jgi:hypothetical protein